MGGENGASSNNGDNGPPPNGFWLTKGKDDDRDDDNVECDKVNDGEDEGDVEQWDNGDNGGATKPNGFGQ